MTKSIQSLGSIASGFTLRKYIVANNKLNKMKAAHLVALRNNGGAGNKVGPSRHTLRTYFL